MTINKVFIVGAGLMRKGIAIDLRNAVSAGRLGVSSARGLRKWERGEAGRAAESRDRTLIALLNLEREAREET